MTKNYLLGCDWGTSSFRVRLIHLPDRILLGEVRTSEGIAPTYTAWQSSGLDRITFFQNQLKKQIDLLAQQTGVALHGTNVVISGMASSTIGLCEVPYATVPFDLHGNQTVTVRLKATEGFPHDTLLISGVRSEHDVMRGEETQLTGLAESLSLSTHSEAILILPGTHSKHLHIQAGQLVDIQTFMTGEVFSILSMHSILKDSVDTSGLPTLTESERQAFLLGVREAGTTGVLKGLFRVRTNQLFQKLDKKENAFYLSGLLIGSELSHLTDENHYPLILCSGSNLFELYQLAFQQLNLMNRTQVVSSQVLDQATVTGQILIFQNQQSHLQDIPVL